MSRRGDPRRRVAVAVPLPLRRTFSYLWPEGLPEPRAGQRVRIPFGRRRLTGIVLEEEVEGQAMAGLRPVEAVVDADPLLPPRLLELIRFAADYYLVPIGEMFRAVLPGGMAPAGEGQPASRPIRRVAVLQAPPAGCGAWEEILPRAPAQRRAVKRLRQGGGRVPVSDLRAAGVSAAVLRSLADRGALAWDEEPLPAARPEGLASAASHPPINLSDEQVPAVEAIRAAVAGREAASFLLHGVTGSGKTEVYLRAAAACLAMGRGVLILVPEIGLTPSLVGRLSREFGPRLAALHSALPARQRRAHWDRVRRGEAPLVVGARSAVLAPLPDVGLIIVDEEQDGSYKQEETPRYHARDLALVRGRLESCPVVLASATPAMETYARAAGGKHGLLTLTRRVARRGLPAFHIIDLRQEFREVGRETLLSRALLEALRDNHAAGGQAMLLRNRRGWAAFLLCRACGEPVGCRNCSVSLTLHRSRGRLLCHYCGLSLPVPPACPSCGDAALQEMGAGTERVEEEIARALPELRILRMDADSVRRQGGHARLLARFAAGEADLLVGTQMIAKGHDFPGVTLVGILGGDQILALPDFRAAEWTFQLATQAAGRAGRGNVPGRVLLQAFRADHYALRRAREHDYAGFFAQEDRFRRALLYPPHAVLAAVRVQHREAARAAALIEDLARHLRADPEGGEHIRVLGPAPAPLARLRGRHRFHLLVKARSRTRLAAVLRRLADRQEAARGGAGAASIDVDPSTIL